MSFDFEKGIQVSPQLINFFIDDMVESLITSLPPEQFVKAYAKYNFILNKNTETVDVSFRSKFLIMNYYILAMNEYFSCNETFTTQHQNFVNMVNEEICAGRISNHNMSRSLIRILFQFTTPLYSFFQSYPVGYDSDIDRHLSLLPPIIRYYVLSDLYGAIAVKMITNAPVDINEAAAVVDRLILAIIKISDSQTATKWINENYDLLVHIDMYDICMSRTYAFANRPVEYTTFSEALPFHDRNWSLPCDTDARRTFTSIVDFYYNSSQHAALFLASDL